MDLVSPIKKRHTTSDLEWQNSSCVVIAGIVDILTQILLCLPVKSLLRLKSVSKQWYSLIADPTFIKKHCLQNPVPIRGFFTHNAATGIVTTPSYEFVSLDGSASSAPFKTLTFIDGILDLKIAKSCNGLLVCGNFTGNSLRHTYYICNPSTSQYRPIAYGSRGREFGFLDLCSVSLAFDPLKSSHYKVACVWWTKKPINSYDEYSNNSYYQLEIYSSETDSWKFCGGAFSAPNHTFSKSGVFWKGSLHWVNMSSVVYFNVDQESRMIIPAPTCLDGETVMTIKYFGEYRGHLQLINAYSPYDYLKIFELETDYTGWTTKYCINLNELKIMHPKIIQDISNELEQLLSRILLVEVNENESSKMVLQVQDKVVSVDLGELSFKQIYKVNPHRETIWLQSAHLYIETLICI